jgi:hypothetical protein
MNRLISKDYEYFKIEDRYNQEDALISRGKFSLRDDESNKIMNMTTEEPLEVNFRVLMICKYINM